MMPTDEEIAALLQNHISDDPSKPIRVWKHMVEVCLYPSGKVTTKTYPVGAESRKAFAKKKKVAKPTTSVTINKAEEY